MKILIVEDEYCKYGEFTGTMVGIFAVDSIFHRKEADFDYFSLVNKEDLYFLQTFCNKRH